MGTQRFSLSEIDEALRKARPYLIDIEDMIKENQNGIIAFELRVNNGKVTDLVIKKVTRKKYA